MMRVLKQGMISLRFTLPRAVACLAAAGRGGVLVWLLAAGTARGQLQVGLELQPAPMLTVTGPTGAVCQVQWSDNLAAVERWQHLGIVTLAGPAALADTNAPVFDRRFYRAVQVPGANWALVPGGSFLMGDNFTNGPASERPVHPVRVGAFYCERFEVPLAEWNDVHQWAVTKGYSFDNSGAGKATNHPVQTVSWHDAVKWCNARSEREGRVPAYYTSAAQTTVYRTGQSNLVNDCVNWAVNGYRLLTEAEWEFAARGGVNSQRFPRGNTISHADANYFAATYLHYDTTGVNDFHPAYAVGDPPFTSPVGSFVANAYGLHDLTGNVWEWCWDSYATNWYAQPAAAGLNPRGSAEFTGARVLRGGSWRHDASFARNASRVFSGYSDPVAAVDALGFRCAITAPTISGQPVFPARLTEWAQLGDGGLRFTVSNVTPGKPVVIEAAGQLGAWTAIATNLPVGAAFGFTNSPGVGPRFFRVWQAP